MSYARRYAKQGDHEVSAAALNTVVVVNRLYVKAKGKTFFSQVLILDNPLVNDGFINNTLELCRQHLRAGVSSGDEQQIELTLKTITMLIGVYTEIDYSTERASKTHAHLAANYLYEGVKSVIPHNMPDVLMEGVRLMGKSAHLFLTCDEPNSIATLAENIAVIACLGSSNEIFRPVTLTAMEQLASLMFSVIRTNSYDIHFAITQLRDDITMAVKFFLKVPDPPMQRVHSSFLAPYYSGTTSQAFLSWLREFVNELLKTNHEDEAANTTIRNIETWADGLFQAQKEILLLAIEKRSGFTFDIIHWIVSVTEMLLTLSNSLSCDDHTRDELRKHAEWLIYVIDWIPDDEETITFVETYRPSEILFEASMKAHFRGCSDLAQEIQNILINWAFKGGNYQTGWGTLEQSIYALSTLVLSIGDQQNVDSLKQKLSDRLSKKFSPSQDIKDQAARGIRRKAATLYRNRHGFETQMIQYQMNKLDQTVLSSLLMDLANLLSPETSNEAINTDFI